MNTKNIQKSAVAFALVFAVGSIGFGEAFGYGGGGSGTKTKVTICQNGNTISVARPAVPALLRQGATRGACVAAVTPAPLVLGATDSKRPNSQQFAPFITSLSSILSGVESGNKSGEISDADATKFNSQLASILTALMSMFR